MREIYINLYLFIYKHLVFQKMLPSKKFDKDSDINGFMRNIEMLPRMLLWWR